MPTITSRHHAFVQEVRRVARGEERRAVLDGWHLVRDAVDAHMHLEAVAISAEPTAAEDQHCLARIDDAGTPILRVSTSVMAALSPVRTPSGVVALMQQPAVDAERLLAPAPALVLVCVGLQDPGNVGAAIRAAEAGGASGVLLAGAAADPWGWKALRAAMGSTFRLPVRRERDVRTACDELRARGVQLVATIPRTGIAMHEADLRVPTALLLGGEGSGLSSDLLERADIGVSIPMRPPVESLNVAVAAGLLVYEARRQRTP